MTTTIEFELRRKDQNTIDWLAKASSDLGRVHLGVSLGGKVITKQWSDDVVAKGGTITRKGSCRYWAIADGKSLQSPCKYEKATVHGELGSNENYASETSTVPD